MISPSRDMCGYRASRQVSVESNQSASSRNSAIGCAGQKPASVSLNQPLVMVTFVAPTQRHRLAGRRFVGGAVVEVARTLRIGLPVHGGFAVNHLSRRQPLKAVEQVVMATRAAVLPQCLRSFRLATCRIRRRNPARREAKRRHPVCRYRVSCRRHREVVVLAIDRAIPEQPADSIPQRPDSAANDGSMVMSSVVETRSER